MDNFEGQVRGDILIVDDVPENLKLLFTMLTEQGYDVRRVLSGKQALKAIEFDPPDLILLDIKMPEMDGYQVCQKLKSSPTTQDIPIIFLSALNDTFDKIKAFEVGAVDYITKPFQLQEVLVRVDNQLRLLNMHRKIQTKNQELESLNQELETFSYSVSHDLRNPLTNISGLSYILKEKHGQKLEPKAKNLLEIIYNSTLKMEKIIENLLRLSQVKYQEMLVDRVNLSNLVKDITSELTQMQPERDVEFIISDNLIVKGDRNLLHIALINLINNAWKYTAKNEKTIIEFGSFSQVKSKSSELVYYMKDNGVGFDQGKIDQLFKPFQRLHTQEEFEGNGIGLAIVQRIINRHGGQIWCKSQPNQGTIFYFTLGSSEK
jgi:two-component system sensor histidine kinase/response regulator